MYARDLLVWLHNRLGSRTTLDQTQKRFESLRGCNLLPRGRENAGVRLSNEQIANAVLSFAHPSPSYAGHASLQLGNLRTVGGKTASLAGESTLRGAVAELIGSEDISVDLMRLTLSIEQGFRGDEYSAVVYHLKNSQAHAVSYVSKYATTLLRSGAEENYDHERLNRLTAIQRSFSSKFFRELSRDVSDSRYLNRPPKTDWLEYEAEEEKTEFNRLLGARPSSRFLNLRVDAQVTWPNEPTRMEFSGYHLVLFPMTKDHSNSISIDLHNENLSAADARTLINRMLSIMSWCDDRPASLHGGWSGNPVPVPVPRENSGILTAHGWHFDRALPGDEKLMQCLAYYRDGLNAYSTGLASHAVLSFFRVFETRYDTRKKVENWVDSIFPVVVSSILDSDLKTFEEEMQSTNVSVGEYVYKNCRVATAHAARDVPSDPDQHQETSRLYNAARIMRPLARHFIVQEYSLSTSYLSD